MVATRVICRICETEQPISQRGLIKRHVDASDPEFYCEGSLKPRAWGLPLGRSAEIHRSAGQEIS